MAWSGSEFEESMPYTRTQTTSRNLLLQTYICAAELATWGVGPDVYYHGLGNRFLLVFMLPKFFTLLYIRTDNG